MVRKHSAQFIMIQRLVTVLHRLHLECSSAVRSPPRSSPYAAGVGSSGCSRGACSRTHTGKHSHARRRRAFCLSPSTCVHITESTKQLTRSWTKECSLARDGRVPPPCFLVFVVFNVRLFFANWTVLFNQQAGLILLLILAARTGVSEQPLIIGMKE